MGKHALDTIEDISLRDSHRYEQDMTAIIARTDDAQEARLALKVAARPPRPCGRNEIDPTRLPPSTPASCISCPAYQAASAHAADAAPIQQDEA